jgi:hypothetical protein
LVVELHLQLHHLLHQAEHITPLNRIKEKMMLQCCRSRSGSSISSFVIKNLNLLIIPRPQ